MTVRCRVKPVWPFSKVLLINKVQNFHTLNYWTVAKLYIFKVQRKLILSDRDLGTLLLRIRRKSLGKKKKPFFRSVCKNQALFPAVEVLKYQTASAL